MEKIPDVIIIVGQNKEINAIKECKKLNIPTIVIIDTKKILLLVFLDNFFTI